MNKLHSCFPFRPVLHVAFPISVYHNSILLIIQAKNIDFIMDALLPSTLLKCALHKYIQNPTTSVATLMTILISASTMPPENLLSNSWCFQTFWKLKSNHSSAQNTPRIFSLHGRATVLRMIFVYSWPSRASSPPPALFSYPSPASPAPLLFLDGKWGPTSGPLQLLFSLPGMFFLHNSTSFPSSFPTCFWPNGTLSVRFHLPIYLKV